MTPEIFIDTSGFFSMLSVWDISHKKAGEMNSFDKLSDPAMPENTPIDGRLFS
jgi:hypothetical protein